MMNARVQDLATDLALATKDRRFTHEEDAELAVAVAAFAGLDESGQNVLRAMLKGNLNAERLTPSRMSAVRECVRKGREA